MNRRFVILIVLYFIGLAMMIYGLVTIGHKIGYLQGYEQGFNACIEENNLYDMY